MSATRTTPSSTSRRLLGIALLLSITLVAGVLVAAALVRGQRPDPLRLAAVPAPAADSADCARLLAALPPDLTGDTDDTGGVSRRELAAPIPPGAAAWGEPPVVLRCGLGRPPTLTASSRLLDVSGVQFLDLTAGEPGKPGRSGKPERSGNPAVDVSTWVAVDRPVYVVVELPPETGSGPLQQIAGTIGRTLPRRELDLPR